MVGGTSSPFAIAFPRQGEGGDERSGKKKCCRVGRVVSGFLPSFSEVLSLAPLIHTYDFPHHPNVSISLFADDAAVFAQGANLKVHSMHTPTVPPHS
ncbi:hypothetical protein TNCV_17821 [Trichonephila clavipes]|nr:hypothetical protein TNCV_17821 [Trichonephila clavipes]